MPYVNDSMSVSTTGDASLYVNFTYPPYYEWEEKWPVTTKDATQYGWRSHGEYDAASEQLASFGSKAKWADTRNILLALERIERATSNPLIRPQDGWEVHERTYSVIERSGCLSPKQVVYQPGFGKVITFTPLYVLGFTPNWAVQPDSQIRTQGGEMFRQSMPTQPHANLAQFVGELRDFPSLFRSADLSSLSGKSKAVGGGYLSLQFAILPFIGDLQKAAEAILDAGPIIRKFVEDSNKIIHRKRTRPLREDAVLISGNCNGVTALNGRVYQHNNIGTPYGNLVVSFKKGCGYDTVRSNFQGTVSVTERLRSFAKFEYFAYDPDNFLTKVRSYEQKARHLLGLTLTPSVVWELTPWSWMLDWFSDIGGLLSYQVSVESDSLVARQCGTVYERKVNVILHPKMYVSSGSWVVYHDDPNTAWLPTVEVSYQRRLPGTPYDMGIDWSGFSSKRWAILGALGLTKAPGIKWH